MVVLQCGGAGQLFWQSSVVSLRPACMVPASWGRGMPSSHRRSLLRLERAHLRLVSVDCEVEQLGRGGSVGCESDELSVLSLSDINRLGHAGLSTERSPCGSGSARMSTSRQQPPCSSESRLVSFAVSVSILRGCWPFLLQLSQNANDIAALWDVLPITAGKTTTRKNQYPRPFHNS